MSGALSTSCATPLTVRFMPAPRARRGHGATSSGSSALPVPGRGERVVVEGDVAERGLAGRLGVAGGGLGRREASAPPADAGRGDADRPVLRPHGGHREDGVVVRVRPAERGVRACARARRTRRRARGGVRASARKSSSGSLASPPAPAERTVAPSASSAPWRSPRGASGPSPAQRLPPTVAWARISRSADVGRAGPSGAAPPTRSETGVVAPIVTVGRRARRRRGRRGAAAAPSPASGGRT